MTAWTAVGDVGNQLLFLGGFFCGFGVCASVVTVLLARFTAKGAPAGRVEGKT